MSDETSTVSFHERQALRFSGQRLEKTIRALHILQSMGYPQVIDEDGVFTFAAAYDAMLDVILDLPEMRWPVFDRQVEMIRNQGFVLKNWVAHPATVRVLHDWLRQEPGGGISLLDTPLVIDSQCLFLDLIVERNGLYSAYRWKFIGIRDEDI